MDDNTRSKRVSDRGTGVKVKPGIQHTVTMPWEGDLGQLTIQRIFQVVPSRRFSRGSHTPKDDIIKEALEMDNMTRKLLENAVNSYKQEHAKGKRKREDTKGRYDTLRSQAANEEDIRDVARFLDLPTKEERQERYQAFFKVTGNAAVKEEVCVICRRRLLASSGSNKCIDELPHASLLERNTAHPAHVLYKDMLLESQLLRYEGDLAYGWCCVDCVGKLESNRLPPFSLANSMWIGNAPLELTRLTIPEQLLIAFHYPRCFVFKLYPKDGGCYNPETLQKGMAGNVTTYALNMPDIAKMLEGCLLPQKPVVLASVIAVTFIGLGKLPAKWLRTTFRVRRRMVYEALIWLKTWNKLYCDVDVSEDRLSQLPEDGIPEEILNIVRQETNVQLAESERESYLPEGTDNDEEGSSSGEITQCIMQAKPTGPNEEGGYAVRRGNVFVDDLGPVREGTGQGSQKNLLAGAYPSLWPYGEGCIEEKRKVPVTFKEHIKWCLQYNDRRFARHHSFPFVAFGIQQKRELMRSAQVQMRRQTFVSDTRLLAGIRAEDVRRAQEAENKGEKVTDPKLSALKKHIFATTSRVSGSDQMRAGYRSQIWGTIVYLCPPTLWTTWNYCDLHDPLVQVFAGEEIDLDNFMRTAGPDKEARAKNVAHNPLAAAMFFDYMVHAMLECLLGIKAMVGRVTTQMGLLGHLSGYYGVVEAQGRGTLHLHMMLWLQHAPTADEMHKLLQSETFRQKVVAYIRCNIRAHLDTLATQELIDKVPREADVAYSRPPDPDAMDFDEQMMALEMQVARSQQMHTCKTTTCLKPDRNGKLICKRGAPWSVELEDSVQANGEWAPKRTYPYANSWSPGMSPYVRCNMDIKILTNGRDTKGTTYYVTGYETKYQRKSHNVSALLAPTFMYGSKATDYTRTVLESNRLMLFRACNVMNRERELSAPQVMAYMMGYGDVYRSHHYAPLYWIGVERLLCDTFEEFCSHKPRDWTNHKGKTSDSESNHQTIDNPEETMQAENVTLEIDTTGQFIARSQLTDYQYRGTELEDVALLQFVVETYEEDIPKSAREKSAPSSDTTRTRGRPRNDRSAYLSAHPCAQTKRRVIRCKGHNTLPSIVGKHPPRRDRPDTYEYYCASMLALLKNWRHPTDLKPDGIPWADAFENFVQGSSKMVTTILSNIQYYYDSAESASNQRNTKNRNPDHMADNVHDGRESDEDGDGEIVALSASNINNITDADLEPEHLDLLEENQVSAREATHARQALEIARSAGIFAHHDTTWESNRELPTIAGVQELNALTDWQIALRNAMQQRKSADTPVQDKLQTHVTLLENMEPRTTSSMEMARLCTDIGNENALTAVDPSDLFTEQRRAFDIIEWHLTESMAGCAPPQLLLHITGEGGVGKSKVIQSVTEMFRSQGVSEQLVKAAYTGIAASLIGGSTLHTITRLSRGKRTASSEAQSKLTAYWKEVQYMIIDEISMVSREFLAKISRIVGKAKMETGSPAKSSVFGGINVIILGDFHQFPPVVARKSAPLYWPTNPARDTEDEIAGRVIYEQFTTVVKLRKQVRVTDPTWAELLQRARHGTCRKAQLDYLRSHIITSEVSRQTDYTNPPWDDAVLVTPRHAVRNQWNAAALRRHCAKTGHKLYICTAKDTVASGGYSNVDRYKVATRTNNKGDLPFKVEISIGMKVMVTYNINTELDIANGSRGTITEIYLDPNEASIEPGDAVVRLQQLPSYILVKLDKTCAPLMTGLPPGVVPIIPMRKTMSIESGGVRKNVSRTQLPITAAYAFTDYRAQGQTLPAVIIDIASPPGKGLTPFNAYVQLSRSSGSGTVRLLRDFEDDLFTRHPSEYLRLEDERLSTLDKITASAWEKRKQLIQIHNVP